MKFCRNASEALWWTQKDFGVCISPCLWRDSDLRNLLISMKFCTNVVVLWEMSLVSIAQIVLVQGCTKVLQYITNYGEKFVKISFDVVFERKI